VKKSDIIQDIESNMGITLFDDFMSKDRVSNIKNYMEHGDYICFDYDKGFKTYFVVFNKTTNETYQCNKINLEQDLVVTGASRHYSYMPVPFISNKNAYSLWHIVETEFKEHPDALETELKEDQVAPGLENREALLKALQKKEEFYMIVEYDFK
jgi:hypothetical protein